MINNTFANNISPYHVMFITIRYVYVYACVRVCVGGRIGVRVDLYDPN